MIAEKRCQGCKNFDSIDKFPVWNKLLKFFQVLMLYYMLLLRGTGISVGGLETVEKRNKQGVELIALISKTILL